MSLTPWLRGRLNQTPIGRGTDLRRSSVVNVKSVLKPYRVLLTAILCVVR